ncbi:ABC transporter ATP-binding protein [Pollutibacter soli]|uniref:ABC transporter ATP-binding protein n=1 Tax=Pollutibacter soli TaxID=3034157 RepID=UPI0030141B44
MENTVKTQENPYFFLLKTAWKYARADRRKYVLIYIFFMLSNVVSSLYPVIWGIFINDIQLNGADVLKHAWIYAGLYLAVKFFDWVFHGPSRIVERKLAFNIGRNFLQELYHKSLRLPVKWHQDHHSGSTINRVRKAHEALRNFFDRGFEYLHTLFKFIFSFAAMLYFSPLFGGVAVLLGSIVVWIILLFDRPYIKTLDQVNEGEHVVSSTLFDSLSNVITVITLRLQDRLEKTLLVRVQHIFPAFKKNTLINEWKWFVTDMLVGVIYAVILVGYVWQNYTPGQTFLLGGLVTLTGYVERFTSVFHNMAYLYTDVVRYATDVRTAMIIPDAYARHHLPERPGPLPETWQKIEIDHLNFIHEKHREISGNGKDNFMMAGLKNIKLDLERGKKIALIGESGSGKSTLLAILRGLYSPEPGVIVTVDGEVQKEGLSLIAEHVTLFPQEPEIFENTIEYNITLGLPYEAAEIDHITELVHFKDVIRQLPKGLQSNIVEKGVNLSGGQKQRLALARGWFAAKDSDIILLDEPTSSVDPKTELHIYEALFAAAKDKVVVSALHRLHLLRFFDTIYVMQHGEVIARGSLQELMSGSDAFKELWRHQEMIK